MPDGVRVFADSSIARRASPASVDRERWEGGGTRAGGTRAGGTGAGADSCAGEASNSKSVTAGGGEAIEASKRAIASPVGVREGDGIFLRAARRSTCLLYTSPSPRDGLLSR